MTGVDGTSAHIGFSHSLDSAHDRSLREGDETSREGERPLSFSGNRSAPDRAFLDSTVHRSFRESSSENKVLKSVLEELASMKINFDPVWTKEYNMVYFEPLQLKRFCIVQISLASLYSILLGTSFVNIEDKDTQTHKIPAYTCLLGGLAGKGAHNPQTEILWTVLRLVGMAMNIVPAIGTLVLLSSMRLRDMVVQRLSSLAALHLIISLMGLFLEDIAGMCRSGNSVIFYTDAGENKTLFYNYSYSGLAQVSCQDTAPYQTLLRWNRVDGVGCSPGFGSLLVYFTLFTIGSSLNIGVKACASLTLVGCFLCFIFIVVRAALLSSTVWFTMAMLCLASAQDSISSYLIEAEKKRQFTQLKVKKLMGELSLKLIQTLIPPNVLDAMPVLAGISESRTLSRRLSTVEFKAAWEIKMATLMFCTLDFPVSNVQDFDDMSRYLQALDKVIEPSGMFKYQFVSTGSKYYLIITCPRAACPHDREQQAAEYPVHYYYDMVQLGWQLMLRTAEFNRTMLSRGGGGGGQTVEMKVGVNCGCVAGIVLGNCRRFYCLYGDAMNVAARMSANAKEGSVCVSPQIASHLCSAAASFPRECSDCASDMVPPPRSSHELKTAVEPSDGGVCEGSTAVYHHEYDSHAGVGGERRQCRAVGSHSSHIAARLDHLVDKERERAGTIVDKERECAANIPARLHATDRAVQLPHVRSRRSCDAGERSCDAGDSGSDVGSEPLKGTHASEPFKTRHPASYATHAVPLDASGWSVRAAETSEEVASQALTHTSAYAASEAYAGSEAYASVSAGARLSIVSRGLHEVKGKGLMELFDVTLLGGGERGRQQRVRRGSVQSETNEIQLSTQLSRSSSSDSRNKRKDEAMMLKKRVSKGDLQALVDEETMVQKMMNVSLNFKDRHMEDEFLESQVYLMRARMTGAVCLHSLMSLWQMYVVMFPDNPEYFMSHGSANLASRIHLVGILLYTQVVVAFVVSALLIHWMWRMEGKAWALSSPCITSATATAKELSARRALARETSQHGRGRSRSRWEGGERRQDGATMTRERRAPLAASKRPPRHASPRDAAPLDAWTMALGRWAFMFLLVFGQATSVAAAHVWPQQSYALAIFSACMTLNFGMSHTINGLTKLQNLGLVVYSLLLLLPTLYKVIQNELLLHYDQVAIILGHGALSLAISRAFGWVRRRTFLYKVLIRKQLETLGAVLFDLVPPHYAVQLIRKDIPGEECCGAEMRGCHTVVALQLDICGFTMLSSALSPVALAETVSKLFSDFDQVVMGTNIFKIDTIGDAYIMVGWLLAEGPQLRTPASGQANEAGALEELDEEQRDLEDASRRRHLQDADGTDATVNASDNATKCGDMLLVAEALLEIVNEHNLASSLPLDVRIGIGTGEVVAGVLGGLSNRFSLQGQAMLVIADLESRAQPGKVHCSGEFMKILSTCERSRDGILSRWHAQPVAPPVAALETPVAAVAQPFLLSEPTPGRIEQSYMLTKQVRGWLAEAQAETPPETPTEAPHPSRDTCTT